MTDIVTGDPRPKGASRKPTIEIKPDSRDIIFINNPNEDNPKFQIVAIDPASGETQVIR